MRIDEELRPPTEIGQLTRQLATQWRLLAQQVNAHSEGLIAGAYNALTAAPTGQTWKQGDFIRNSAPTEQGASPNKYVVFGWICVASGTPGTWVPCRFLTGN